MTVRVKHARVLNVSLQRKQNEQACEERQAKAAEIRNARVYLPPSYEIALKPRKILQLLRLLRNPDQQWCLPTASPLSKTARDLIYKRGQAGVTKASVTVVFDNSDRTKSPNGYEHCAQITVTRQVSH